MSQKQTSTEQQTQSECAGQNAFFMLKICPGDLGIQLVHSGYTCSSLNVRYAWIQMNR